MQTKNSLDQAMLREIEKGQFLISRASSISTKLVTVMSAAVFIGGLVGHQLLQIYQYIYSK